MNNKPNKNKLAKNIKTLITYLYINKNKFLPNHKKSPNFYFDHKTIANDLQWSERKAYNILRKCIEQNYIDTVSLKYCPLKQSRLYHINFFNIPDFDTYLDATTMKSSAEQFVKKQLLPKNDDLLSIHLMTNSFLKNLPYGKTYRKSLSFIDPLFNLYVDTNKKIECHTPVYNSLVNEINAANRFPCETVFFNENITIDKPNICYRVKKSIRATSHFCNSPKSLRPELLNILRLPYSFDIHAAVPALFRLLNFNEFNPDVNIRQMILGRANMNHVITEKQLKELLPRFIFTSSFEQSFAQIARIKRLRKYPDNIPDVIPCWKQLYDAVHEIIGDTSIHTEIFKFESLLELRTVRALRNRDFYTSNIYDCFYSEAAVDVIKHELMTQAAVLYDDYSKNKIQTAVTS
jgi:hypothetical protein